MSENLFLVAGLAVPAGSAAASAWLTNVIRNRTVGIGWLFIAALFGCVFGFFVGFTAAWSVSSTAIVRMSAIAAGAIVGVVVGFMNNARGTAHG